MNPRAPTLWLFLTSVGFLSYETTGAAIGLAIGTGLSIICIIKETL